MLYLRTSVFSLKGERGLGKEGLYKARHSLFLPTVWACKYSNKTLFQDWRLHQLTTIIKVNIALNTQLQALHVQCIAH